MIIISHRGYWKDAAEKNRPVAFARSFDLGYGTETDVREMVHEPCPQRIAWVDGVRTVKLHIGVHELTTMSAQGVQQVEIGRHRVARRGRGGELLRLQLDARRQDVPTGVPQ